MNKYYEEIDKAIKSYEEYKPYLDKLVEEYLEKEEDKEKLMYAAIFSTWKKAVINMANDKGLIIK